MNHEVYTIGGTRYGYNGNALNGGTPDGENVSQGSWTGLDGIRVPPGL